MGLNFHVVCHQHKVTGMIARGEETLVLHRFYAEHAHCRRFDKHAVEVQGDGESEQWWMLSPPPQGYQELGLLTGHSTPPLLEFLDLGSKLIVVLVMLIVILAWWF